VEPAAAAEEAPVTALEALEVTDATSLLREASWEETRAEMEERAPPLTVESSWRMEDSAADALDRRLEMSTEMLEMRELPREEAEERRAAEEDIELMAED